MDMEGNMLLSVKQIQDLIESVSKNKLGGLKLQQGDFYLELKGVQEQPPAVPAAVVGAPAQYGPIPPALQEKEAPVPAEASRGKRVTSPIVGTFYEAPAPGKDPYVTVGSKVQKGDVLFIIESMKLMNEVASEFDGTVTEILVEDGQGVEYGQPILCIE